MFRNEFTQNVFTVTKVFFNYLIIKIIIQKMPISLSKLNAEQRQAVTTLEGPLLVLAGAGSGKTRVITYRIARLIENRIRAENIVALTFTNKAAKEMKERVSALVSENEVQKVFIGTFHSFCAKILRKEIKSIGFTPNFTIANDSDQKSILKQAIAELGLNRDENPADLLASMIGKAKNQALTPEELHEKAEGELEEKVASVYLRYQQILRNQNMLDFDDLLLFVIKIWEKNPKVLEDARIRYQYLLVDEYQDTNYVQFELLRQLAGERHNLCVVGDDDQSIYQWRGADVTNILKFPQFFENCVEIKLEQNYRSTRKILRAANHVIMNNQTRYPKKLWSELGEGNNISIIKNANADEEAGFVAEAILDIKTRGKCQKFGDIAILYRSNYLSRTLENAMRNSKIPYKLVGSKSFYQRKEVVDVLAYLKLMVNPRDNQSLLRIIGIPPRGVGDQAITVLKDLHNSTHISMTDILGDNTFHERISPGAVQGVKKLDSTLKKFRKEFFLPGQLANKSKSLLEEIGFFSGLLKMYKNRNEAESRQENVYELLSMLENFSAGNSEIYLQDFIESCSLLDENDKEDEDLSNQDNVTLMTTHAAKGLEFPWVFIIGLEQNLFPHERSLKEGNEEEERRLFYVALTRAKENLMITYSRHRSVKGKTRTQAASKFLHELPDDLIERYQQPSEFFKPVDADLVNEAFANIYAQLDKL